MLPPRGTLNPSLQQVPTDDPYGSPLGPLEASWLIDKAIGMGQGGDVMGSLDSRKPNGPFPIHDHPVELASIPRIGQRLCQDARNRWEMHIVGTR